MKRARGLPEAARDESRRTCSHSVGTWRRRACRAGPQCAAACSELRGVASAAAPTSQHQERKRGGAGKPDRAGSDHDGFGFYQLQCTFVPEAGVPGVRFVILCRVSCILKASSVPARRCHYLRTKRNPGRCAENRSLARKLHVVPTKNSVIRTDAGRARLHHI